MTAQRRYRHSSIVKGEIAQAKVISVILACGYEVFVPFGDHSAADLVAHRDGRFTRVQVKYLTKKKGVLPLQFRNVHCNSKGSQIKPIDKDSIDLFGIYCPDTDECYFINPRRGADGTPIDWEDVRRRRWPRRFTHSETILQQELSELSLLGTALERVGLKERRT